MPLVPTTLSSGILPTMAAPDAASAADAWTKALTTYLAAAVPPLAPATTDPIIRGAITPVMLTPNPAPNGFAAALESGLIAAVMAAIPLAVPGAVPVATPTLQPALMAVFATGMAAPTGQVVIEQLAAAIDTWCRTVVYGVPPQPPSIPLS